MTLCAKVTIDREAGEVLIDFAGSSAQSPKGVNVVLNYTRAYSTFAIRSILNPELPNNLGSILPIKVTAPEGTIVNCRYPAPVAGRRHFHQACVQRVLQVTAQDAVLDQHRA